MLSVSLLLGTIFVANPSPPVLPLERVRLYETGVGYFERSGRVTKGSTSLPLPASHLDDALKTLVVLSEDSRITIGGIEFASSVSEGMARAIAGLPVEPDGDDDDSDGGRQLSYHDLLTSLEGIKVEVVTKAKSQRIGGTLVEVLGPYSRQTKSVPKDHKPVEGGAPPEPEYTLVVRTSAGALRRISTENVVSVRPVEDGANARIDVALGALSSRSSQAEHPLRVQVEGSGQLDLGYIAETPVWRTTYRLVLQPKSAGATLQAWALIHNDTDEDWDDVGIELVNGRPTSFLFPLAAPRYTRRELAEPEVELSTVPQLLNTTSDRIWGDFIGDAFGVGGLGLVGTGSGGGGRGMGSIGVGSVGTVGAGAGGPELGDLADFAQATGEESGAMFTYSLANPLDLEAHHSALVPLVSQTVEAESITWFSSSDTDALMGARLLNDTKQTLPAGTVAFFHDGGFAGESGFERLKPGEQAFLIHGIDLDVDLARSKAPVGEELQSLHFDGGRLHETLVVESSLTLDLHNRSGRDRLVYVGLPVSRNAKIEGYDQLDFDHNRNMPLAKFYVAAQTERTTKMRVTEASHRYVDLADVDVGVLDRLAGSEKLPVQQRETLLAALEIAKEIHRNRTGRTRRFNRIRDIDTELERVREDLRALGATGLKDKATKQLSQRIVDLETQFRKAQRKNETAKREEARLQTKLETTLSALNV